MSVRVRIIQLGKSVQAGEWDAPPTLAAALAEHGMPTEGLDVRINGRPASPTHVLADGDMVTIVPRIKGGQCSASEWRGPRLSLAGWSRRLP